MAQISEMQSSPLVFHLINSLDSSGSDDFAEIVMNGNLALIIL
jgi:hypothetical protein